MMDRRDLDTVIYVVDIEPDGDDGAVIEVTEGNLLEFDDLK